MCVFYICVICMDCHCIYVCYNNGDAAFECAVTASMCVTVETRHSCVLHGSKDIPIRGAQ